MHTNSIWMKLLVLFSSISLFVSCGGGGGGSIHPAPANEGSVANPVNLGTVSTTLTHAGSIADYGVSFYKFTTGPNSGSYVISLTNTQSDLSWALLSDPGFTTVIMECDNFIIPGTNDEICSVPLTAGTTYYLGIEEWDVVAGTYTLGITAPAPPPPPKPTGVSTTVGSGKVTISWSAVTGATSYNVYWSTLPGGALSGGTKISGITATSYDHFVLTTDIAYYYVVTAQNAYGESAKSSPEVNATVPTPTAPLVAFVTSTSGNGILGSWADAGGKSGLAAADAICQSRASAAGLAGNFRAWISDRSNDAYCRVHNLAGKKTSNCGLPTLPAAAGPWVRTDGYPYSGNISELTNLGLVYAPARYDEYGTLVPGPTIYFTNTHSSGQAIIGGTMCSDWTSASSYDFYVGAGNCDVTAVLSNYTECTNSAVRLLCMQTGGGPVLQKLTTTGKKVFVSSTNGTGNLASWPDAGGNIGIAAGDKVCQSLAANAGLANAANFKAWLADSSTNAIDHITNNGSNGPWVRLDGMPIANNKNDLTDGSLFTSISLDDKGDYNGEYPNVWTGTEPDGTLRADLSCNNWTDGTASYDGMFGQVQQAGLIWTHGYAKACDTNVHRIYCFED